MNTFVPPVIVRNVGTIHDQLRRVEAFDDYRSALRVRQSKGWEGVVGIDSAVQLERSIGLDIGVAVVFGRRYDFLRIFVIRH